MQTARPRPLPATGIGLFAIIAAVALASAGCGPSETAPLPDEEAKSTRAYRLSHDRVDAAIKAKEAKDAKKSAARKGR